MESAALSLKCGLEGHTRRRTWKNKSYCVECNNSATRKYRARNLAAHRERNRKAAAARYARDPERIREIQKRYRAKKNFPEFYRTLRREVILHYGEKCACCGEGVFEFLVLDHIEGAGNQHRNSIGRGPAYWQWFKKNGYPSGFQVLCHNCNAAKSVLGTCPHQRT